MDEGERHQHDEAADRLERTADDLEHQGEKLDRQIDITRRDWESKLSDGQTPGAAEPAAAAPGGRGAPEDDERVPDEERENAAGEDGGPA